MNSCNFETLGLKKDGQVFSVSLTICPIIDPENRVIGTSHICQDISERKRAEEERKQAAEKLAESYKIEKAQRQELEEEAKARGLFISSLAHELRTPLTPILN